MTIIGAERTIRFPTVPLVQSRHGNLALSVKSGKRLLRAKALTYVEWFGERRIEWKQLEPSGVI